MTTMTPQKNPLRPCHQGITLVNNVLTCLHKKPMVRRTNRKNGEGFWACEKPRGKDSCEQYLYFNEERKYYSPTPSTGGRPQSRAKADGQDEETGPTRRAITPTPTARTTPAVGSETAMTSVSTRRGIPERKRPISPDASENPPSKKHRSGPQSGQDPTARILFPSAPHNQAAADRSHTRASTCAQPNENEPPSNLGGGKLSERHVSSQTSDGSFRDSPRRIPRVPLGHADTNRV
ncbi:hypothetical protein ED733_000225 [Metarhizium rileyi]|uniref:Uncharacterized protein n=1 Tax=Metarhizium rileyi (strain RCEF 4871) TaxID=1649241 RepID=A0A5C6G2Q6_METRR|nr:hypothetical protein ED733_000225 [Metarhizium rileyi]